ncbi:hypothetical protein CapIbe_020675 [Capra ibex]
MAKNSLPRRLPLSCLGLESAGQRNRTKVVTVTGAVPAVGPLRVPSWDCPSVPCVPCQPLPSPASSSSQARLSPERRRASGRVGKRGRTRPGRHPLPAPSLPWAPHQTPPVPRAGGPCTQRQCEPQRSPAHRCSGLMRPQEISRCENTYINSETLPGRGGG